MRTRDASECNAHILQKKGPFECGANPIRSHLGACVSDFFQCEETFVELCSGVKANSFPSYLACSQEVVHNACTSKKKQTTYIRVFVFSGTLHLHLQRELWTPRKQNTSKRRRRLQELLSEGAAGENTRKHGRTRRLFSGFFATRQWEYRLAFSFSTNSVFSSKNFHIV